jgi:hypothetical protein
MNPIKAILIFLVLLLRTCDYLIETNELELCATNYAPCMCEKRRNEMLIESLTDHADIKDYKVVFSGIFNYESGKQKNVSSVINCSNRQIRTIPKFKTLGYTKQPSIDCLDLTHNQIEILSESVFYGLIFRCIDFSFNKINKVSRNAFSGLLNSLYVLKFDYNEMTSSALPAYFISKVSQLQVLSMAHNKIGLP